LTRDDRIKETYSIASVVADLPIRAQERASILLGTTPAQTRVNVDAVWVNVAASSDIGLAVDNAKEHCAGGGAEHQELGEHGSVKRPIVST
jgi:hypothetical protein